MRAVVHSHQQPAPEALGRLRLVDRGLLPMRALLRRTNTKFVVTRASLEPLLDELVEHYGVVETAGRRLSRYSTLYHDTADLRCYHDHRRGVRPRHKVRIRHYLDRSETFLEVKTRRGMLSEKLRFLRPNDETSLADEDRARIAELTGLVDLEPQAWTLYSRATLLGLELEERVTIDTDLELRTDEGSRAYEQLAIVEVKQARLDRNSPAMLALRALGHRSMSVSKYCAAIATTRATRLGRLAYTVRQLSAIG